MSTGVALGRETAMRSGPIDDAFATLARRPDVISFAVGAPDPALLPGELVASLAAAAIAKYGSAALQYGLTRGFPPLLEQARILLSGRGIGCSPERVHIATGGSGALHNICMALLYTGGVVLVETPTYGPAVKVFRSHGALVIEVASDADGILPEALDSALAHHDPAFVYLLPTFQNPTGRTMSAARRARVAEVITRHQALVVEDDVYTDLRYRGEPVPTLWSFAPDRTAYITSLSKTLAPALRIGITVLPDDLLEPVLALKQGIDMQTSAFNQAIAAEFLGTPVGSAHLSLLVESYAAKLNTVVTALGRYLPSGFSWTEPDGGMFVWVEGPADFDADMLVAPALNRGVAFLPGSAFFAAPDAPRNALRLSFATVPEHRIEPGVELLSGLCA
ncbi:aminotransferase-like domain-containing protein [Nocardia pseudovaccinii]|uniref:aminotransferase-like domain-containing protein n=1 Tax=Nocardia pseudovaccinii TaxID=189540 RepID=UPI000AB084FC|nr:PLP-dependent aminotransferase family protein [Nocardia pseudovaccinii]